MAISLSSLSLSKHSLSNSSSIPASNPSIDPSKPSVLRTQNILGSKANSGGIERTPLRLCGANLKKNSDLKSQASREPARVTKELKSDKSERIAGVEPVDLFNEMKQRFLSFKKNRYMKDLELYEKLAKEQAPKVMMVFLVFEFMVIACADSRVCPSSILGFQPGEAFVVRNVANMVPPYENGPTETNAALEFAVNSLKVENILVIGHSRCGGIRALMSMHDDVEPSGLIGSWVSVGMNARVKTKAATHLLNFDQQCKHCEKESVNCSLVNLLSYPWVEEKVRNGELNIHGGYYDFVDCSFEKWTLYKENNSKDESGKVAVKDRAFCIIGEKLNYQHTECPANSPCKTSLFFTSHIYKNPKVFSRKSTLHTSDFLKSKTHPSPAAIAISTTMANHIFPLFILPLTVIMSMALMHSKTVLVEARQLLELTLPELPKPEFPELPKPVLPELPKPEFPDLPKPELPELPKFEIPKLPEFPSFPHFPDLSKPTLPAIPKEINPSHSTTSP
ncbi:hypothetical protein SADUNF_Sadunf07G0098600 [Salix dunnii]|uniref:carbonic anhydrase n=1 Tax=Salix dunnii TaxID=1413687 RepID=A0A835MW53_9ROSI|nr:hypothetical protein SADUNF_Sadunf07G0098600 [Salix dunnii]